MQRRDFYTHQDSSYLWRRGGNCDGDRARGEASGVGGKVIFQLVGGNQGAHLTVIH